MADEGYKVQVLMKHPSATVTQVHLAPGEETPEHSHADDYIVHPRAATTLLKTTYKDGQKQSEETVEHKPGEPYFVIKNADGVTFTLKNIGDAAMQCDKTQIHRN